MTSICFIDNPTSISFLIGRELKERGYDVTIYDGNYNTMRTNLFISSPPQTEQGKPSLAYRAWKKARRKIDRHLGSRKFDVELRSFSKPQVNAKHRVVVYHGNDLRDSLWPIEYPCFYSTKDLGLRYLDNSRLGKDAIWLPRCVVTEYFSPQPRLPFDGKNITIGFFPTDPKMEEKGWQGKGVRFFYRAIEELKRRGYNVELLTPEIIGFKAHDQMQELLKRCHVVADQFLVGMYGVISLESIMTNRPVVCYVEDAYFEFEEMKSQIINCKPEPHSIADALIKAIDHPLRPELISQLYSPKRSTDVLEQTLRAWGFI